MRPVVRKKSAFEGDILEACKLTSEAIDDILKPSSRQPRRKKADFDNSNS